METKISNPQHLNLSIETDRIGVFFKLIESGFKLKINTGLSIRELFCDQLGVSEHYYDDRIQTVFLDSKPVDNDATALVYDGARIALAAAMPGLVGATFRKGGQYAYFRGTISHSETGNSSAKGEGEIVVKLFNMVARELGPAFLKKGIIIEGKHFHDFVLRNAEDLNAGCHSMHLNDQETNVTELLKESWESTEVFLRVIPETSA